MPLVTDPISNDATTLTLMLDEARGAVPISYATASLGSLVLMPTIREMLTWFDGHRARGTWTLRVRDDAAGNGGTLLGWSLTICPEAQATCPAGTQPRSLLSADFESNDGGFTHAGRQDEWEWGTPSYAPISNCASGMKCWKTDLDNTYGAEATASLSSPLFAVPSGAASIVVSWSQKHQLEALRYDDYSADLVDGAGWPLRSLYELGDGTGTSSVGAGETIAVAAGWARRQATIAGVAGQNLGLRYRLTSDSSVNFAGVAIDDVSVVACLPSADLSVTTSDAPDPVSAGGTITYTLTVANAGPSVASGVQVTDVLPLAATFVSAIGPAGWTLTTPAVGASGTVTAAKAAMAVGESAAISVAVRAPVEAATLTNTATVAATEFARSQSANDAVTVTTTVIASADLTTTLSGTPDPVVAGQPLTYTIGVSDAGPSAATAVQVTDTLPTGTTFVSATGLAGWTLATPAVGGGGVVTASVASLAAGASATVTLVVQVPASAPAATLTNTVTASSATADPSAANNTATATTTVQPSPPAITITSPTTAATYTATGPFVTLSGSASDDDRHCGGDLGERSGAARHRDGDDVVDGRRNPAVAWRQRHHGHGDDTDAPSSTATATLTVTRHELQLLPRRGRDRHVLGPRRRHREPQRGGGPHHHHASSRMTRPPCTQHADAAGDVAHDDSRSRRSPGWRTRRPPRS